MPRASRIDRTAKCNRARRQPSTGPDSSVGRVLPSTLPAGGAFASDSLQVRHIAARIEMSGILSSTENVAGSINALQASLRLASRRSRSYGLVGAVSTGQHGSRRLLRVSTPVWADGLDPASSWQGLRPRRRLHPHHLGSVPPAKGSPKHDPAYVHSSAIGLCAIRRAMCQEFSTER